MELLEPVIGVSTARGYTVVTLVAMLLTDRHAALVYLTCLFTFLHLIYLHAIHGNNDGLVLLLISPECGAAGMLSYMALLASPFL